jgi:enoyl-CoA hydratase/carnithine racemase
MNFKTLKHDVPEPGILLVTLNRPEVLNAINSTMMAELLTFWQQIESEASTRCVVLTGAGKAFCAGADLKERNGLTVETWREHHEILERAMEAMIDCPVPVIAAVNGAAFGGGLELVLGSDFAYAAADATFAMPEAKLGFIPGAMGTQTLPRACGARRAKEICLTGDAFTAAEAFAWGVVNRVCEPEGLLHEVLAVARKIAANAPLAVLEMKRAIAATDETDLKSGYRVELEAYNRLIPTEDRKEGICAFNEKRAPRFQGR